MPSREDSKDSNDSKAETGESQLHNLYRSIWLRKLVTDTMAIEMPNTSHTYIRSSKAGCHTGFLVGKQWSDVVMLGLTNRKHLDLWNCWLGIILVHLPFLGRGHAKGIGGQRSGTSCCYRWMSTCLQGVRSGAVGLWIQRNHSESSCTDHGKKKKTEFFEIQTFRGACNSSYHQHTSSSCGNDFLEMIQHDPTIRYSKVRTLGLPLRLSLMQCLEISSCYVAEIWKVTARTFEYSSHNS